jgi:hypothetical protein
MKVACQIRLYWKISLSTQTQDRFDRTTYDKQMPERIYERQHLLLFSRLEQTKCVGTSNARLSSIHIQTIPVRKNAIRIAKCTDKHYLLISGHAK